MGPQATKGQPGSGLNESATFNIEKQNNNNNCMTGRAESIQQNTLQVPLVAGPQSSAYTKRSETSRNRSNQDGRLIGSQNSHSKILANLSRNFQEFKEDVRQLKESIG